MIKQRTPEWYQARCGYITASNVWKLFDNEIFPQYLEELIIERTTGMAHIKENTSEWVKRGAELEDEAIEALMSRHNLRIGESTFQAHPTIPWLGASPDGIVDLGGYGKPAPLEIKCPNTSTHERYFRTQQIQRKHILQIQTQMMVLDAQEGIFVSYDNRVRPEYQLFIQKVPACVYTQYLIEITARKLNDEIDKKLKAMGVNKELAIDKEVIASYTDELDK